MIRSSAQRELAIHSSGVWLAANDKASPTFEDLKTAVVHGSVVASYTCEAFSTHKLQDVTAADVAERIAALRGFTSFVS